MAGSIVKVSGPLVVASGMADVKVYDVVRVSKQRLIGEVIELRGEMASIQVYEETSGLGPGEPVETTGAPLSVELALGAYRKHIRRHTASASIHKGKSGRQDSARCGSHIAGPR